MYVLYVCVSEGIRVKYIYVSGLFLKSSVSEIHVKRICVNQGVGVEVLVIEMCY
jgi:hypothetical protein